MPCNECKYWVTQRIRVYEDGTHIQVYQSPQGKGLCDQLKIETDPFFHCIKFLHSDKVGIKQELVEGAPWQHWKMDKCPDCDGRGSTLGEFAVSCGRCQGLGLVRYYDDGYIGDERTRRHPKEPNENVAPNPDTVLTPLPKPDVLGKGDISDQGA